MHYANRFVASFNGEIYNFRELRNELVRHGHIFTSDSDTEVVLASVAEWGVAGALRRMRGMFAVAVWDETKNTLYLARDRIGEKPLYYSFHRGYLFFSSEPRALVAAGVASTTPSEEGLYVYLANGYFPSSHSAYRGVGKLPPATLLSLLAHSGAPAWHTSDSTPTWVGDPRSTRYWSLPQSSESGLRDSGTAAAALNELLSESVKEQLACDVPVGVFLSGGIDSSAVAALAQQVSHEPIRTFTIKFDDPRFDESQRAAAIAKHLGTRHEEIIISEETLVDHVIASARDVNEPISNASYFALQLMAKEARERVKVALSGDGGDELFGGYNRYRLTPPLWQAIRRVPIWLRRRVSTVLAYAAQTSGTSERRLPFSLSSQSSFSTTLNKLSRVLPAESLGEFYRTLTRCWIHPCEVAAIEPIEEPPFDCSLEEFLRAASDHDIVGYLPEDNLAKADRATMRYGLEQRIPLLDYRIVEFSRGLSLSEIVGPRNETKWPLRQVVYRYVPESLLNQPKMGFTAPIGKWLTGPLREWAADLVHSGSLFTKVPLKKAVVERAWGSLLAGRTAVEWEVWAIVMYLAWLDGSEPMMRRRLAIRRA